MKGCLKRSQSSPASPHTQSPLSPRKAVTFESDDSLEQVFWADEWDRTPTEPSRKLSYQDLLELKEIQLSLPRANQPADAVTGRLGSHYLKNVPIGLLPLLPDSSSTAPPSPRSPATRPTTSPMSPSWASFTPNSRQCPLPTSPPLGGVDALLKSPHHPRHLSHLPPAPTQAPKPKPRFAFLPLLDSSSPDPRSRSPSPDLASDTDPPTPSLSNASLESSPLSRASSCSPEPPFFQLPPPRKRPGFHDPYAPVYGDDQSDTETGYPAISSTLANMRLGASNPPYGHPSKPQQPFGRPPLTRFVPPPPPAPAPKPTTSRKRNVIYVNGMEMELDDSDDDEPSTPPAVIAPTPRSPPRTSPVSICRPTPSSPTLKWQSSTSTASPTESSPFSGLHAPVRFKRQAPSTKGDSSSSISTSPPSRRGSISCSPRVKPPHVVGSPRSPVLMPRA
ncbi:hypothetical protein CC1G_05888 [Coprinopsis cinerea okayama7|uniref:Uncharacterized protein n=1 Tax=Coprinopsis cinerea (strain Okayama-7 / 130 / ATCC MYA-4618 / FGSC 9003) TaxID=240176 RepID=A8NAD7_COPC7|nr:hypothetical protein CC1G_05888 [Coprinopsis cinerea okayama7\|eukprot:XP_001831789.1 hypothetical protein CC1G_05888 [Coprinopsis cinerea okayama7\